MSMRDAEAFLERAEVSFDELKDDQQAVLAKVRAAGLEATHEELLQAFMDRYGAELTPEQLDKIAAG
jgi:hypothetical protein